MSITNEQIYTVLLQVKEDIGELRAHRDLSKERMDEWEDTSELIHTRFTNDIKSLEATRAKQLNFMAIITGIGASLGAGIGYLVAYFTRGH